MIGDQIEGPDYDEDYCDDNYCRRCGGDGWIVTCIDDLCRGSDECIHGDGYGTCPDCKGKGFIGPDDEPTVW